MYQYIDYSSEENSCNPNINYTSFAISMGDEGGEGTFFINRL